MAEPSDRVSDRVMRGETPLQGLARQGEAIAPSSLRSIERFPYYTAFPFAWYHKIFQPTPRLSRADGPIPEFRKWARQFYLDGDPRAVNR
jgi:hypothetical protein